MIKKIVNIIAFLFLIQLNVFSQSSENLFRYADSIKSIKGEESVEYLDVLSIAIQTASDEGNIIKAYNKRKLHSEIFAKKYGAQSKEYANDMFLLGYDATMLYDIDGANYYYNKYIEICDNIGVFDTIAYLLSIENTANNYYNQEINNPEKDFDDPNYKLNLAEKLFEDFIYKIDSYKVNSLWNKVHAKLLVGYIQLLKYDYNTAMDNFTYAVDNSILVQDTMMYVDAILGISNCYVEIAKSYINNNKFYESIEYLKNGIEHYERVYYDNNIDIKYKQSNFGYYYLSQLYSLISMGYSYNADYNNSILYLKKSMDLLLANEGEKSLSYISQATELMHIYTNVGNYSDALNIKNVISDVIGYASKDDIVSYLQSNLIIYSDTGKIEELNNTVKEYIEYVKAFWSVTDEAYINCLEYVSSSYLSANMIEETIIYADECISIINCQEKVNELTLAYMYLIKGSAFKFKNMDESITLLDKAYNISHEHCNYSLMLSTTMEKGIVYWQNGYIYDALDSFDSCIEISRIAEFNNLNNLKYIQLLNNISVCNIEIGNYAEAINLLNKIKSETEKIHGKDNDIYLQIIANIAMYNACIGDFVKCENILLEAIEISDKIYGSKTNDMSLKLQNNLAVAYIHINEYEKAKDILLSNVEITESLYGENYSFLSTLYTNCGLVSGCLEETDQCIEYTEKSLEISKLNNLTNSIQYISALFQKARLLTLKEDSSANELYQKIISYIKSNNNLDISWYIYTLSWYYHFAIVSNSKVYSLEIDFINKKLEQFYLDEMIMMTDSERNTYLSKSMNIEYINNAILSIGLDNKHNDELYDFVLKTKGIQLQTANEINNVINSSGNEELFRDWDKLKHIKMALLRNDSKELRQQADDLERSVLQQSKELSEYTELFKTGWVEVRDALSKNDVAIEFVSYINLKSTDTIYGAFVLKNDWKNPKYIELCNNSEIREIIKNKPSKLYSKELSNKLYKHIWEPLEKYMNKNDNVYFSPSGAIHTLSLGSLYDNEGIMLEEKYNMYRASTTKNICIKQETPSYKSAAIYGGLRYDIDSLQYIKENTYTEDSTIRAGWKYLYGTKKESDTIAQMMSESSVETKLYQEYYGDEASFKNLSGNDIDIMHIATHGYFLNNETSYKDFIMKEIIRNINENQYMIRDNDNPLYRSGLMMSGCNGSWQNKEQFNDNKEDGVLTSAEISFLDFSNTDLVVLSACETALGNVTMDGVWGLQRAFKNAGVNTIIMSLWKVDDEATSYFMVNFYKQLLGGSSKRDAFNTAKKLTREKYEDPYYWSAFIMLD